MASWAAVAKAAVAPAVEPAPAPTSNEGLSVVVVDANALISGVRLEGFADRAITIPEVLAEVRDKQSRAYLASLPFGVEACEPDEVSVKAGERTSTRTRSRSVVRLLAAGVLRWLASARHTQSPLHTARRHAPKNAK